MDQAVLFSYSKDKTSSRYKGIYALRLRAFNGSLSLDFIDPIPFFPSTSTLSLTSTETNPGSTREKHPHSGSLLAISLGLCPQPGKGEFAIYAKTYSIQVDPTFSYFFQPAHYLAHLIGHEGPGSLLSFLKNQHLATSVAAGCLFSTQHMSFFQVSIQLYPQALGNCLLFISLSLAFFSFFTNCKVVVTNLHASPSILETVDKVVLAVFQYINMITKAGPQEWIFEEVKPLLNFFFFLLLKHVIPRSKT